MKGSETYLWKEKISKLLLTFAVPCVISFIVNALYNIVDQIFIGRWVNYLANGATNVVFPLTMICLWFAFLFWDWAASFLSLRLWEWKRKEGAKWVATGIAMAVITALLFCLITIIFLPELLNLFGCTDALRDYATQYWSIIAIWIPFFMIGATLNSIIRADWNPKFSMLSMVVWAIINILLDPLFIFVFDLWIAWAAYATIISQFITFGLNTRYATKLNTISLNIKLFKLELPYIAKIVALWVSSFINQISIVAVIAVSNNMMAKYGAQSKFGSEIPITVLGIVMKVSMILNSIIIGISAGSQPIIGYNYWAKFYWRVKEALNLILLSCTSISLIAFVLFQSIPETLIWIFGEWNELYIEFSTLAFRIYLLFCISYWVQIPAWFFFQSIWKSRISAILSLSRQVIILIPAFIILWYTFGIIWILYSWALADFLAFILAIFFLRKEVKKLWKKVKFQKEQQDPLKSLNFSSELFEVVSNRSLLSNN